MNLNERVSIIDGSIEQQPIRSITLKDAAQGVIDEGNHMFYLLEKDKVVEKQQRLSLVDGSVEEIEVFVYKPFPFNAKASIKRFLERKEDER